MVNSVLDEQPQIQLSQREQQVLELVVTGASNKEIAKKLVISVNTVKVHMRNIFEKLGVQSRTEASTLAIQGGLVSVAESGSPDNDTESSPAAARTFLIEANPALSLPRWQQFYLLSALLLALLVAFVPLLTRETPNAAPELPVLYRQAPTPAPAAAQPANPANRWATRNPMPTGRAGLALVAQGNRIFAIGGVRGNNQATRSVEIFDAAANSWAEGSSKPTAATNILGAAVGGQIFVPGGCTDDGQAADMLEIYTPQSDEWTSGAALPAARCGYALAVLSDTLYLFGGWNGQIFEDTIFAYSPAKDTWDVLPQTLPKPMGFAGAAPLNGLIYLAGGFDGNNELAQTYAFDPQTGALTPKAPLNESRGGLGLIGGAANLYAIGGGWNHALNTSEKYDPATDAWSTFETPFNGKWRNPGLTAIDTTIYAAGGWDGSAEEFMDSFVSYQYLYQLFLPISSFNKNDE